MSTRASRTRFKGPPKSLIPGDASSGASKGGTRHFLSHPVFRRYLLLILAAALNRCTSNRDGTELLRHTNANDLSGSWWKAKAKVGNIKLSIRPKSYGRG